MSFKQKLENITFKNNSLLCIGLDTDLEKMPRHLLKQKDSVFVFNKTIIDHTFDLVCAYKLNSAFYEAYGEKTLVSLKKTIEYLKTQYSEIPIILDAKRTDIANTSNMYAKAVFDYFRADAVTVFPYLGLDAIKPFIEYKDKLTVILIKTSNPDSGMFQDLKIASSKEPLYLTIAKEIKNWNFPNIGLFVGARYPEELKNVRHIFPESIILTAGIGAQKAIIKKTIKSGADNNGINLICNNSREIIYASCDKNFYKKSREKAQNLKDLINTFR